MIIPRTSNIDLSLEWKKAWEEKSVFDLKNLLLQDYIPEDVNAILTFESKETTPLNLIDILLDNNTLDEDVEFFKIADKLLLKGAKLPPLYQEEKNFEDKEEYFIYLVRCSHDLFIALRKKNTLLMEEDSKKQTLLHHAARIGDDLDPSAASLIYYLLFNAPNINFNLQDHNGNTPLHIAAINSHKLSTCKYIFPNYLKAAFISGFDFETLNHQGQAVLHIAARTTYDNINNIEQVLNSVPYIPLDTLSSSGTTALYYAINHMHLREAHSLLQFKANPTIFGKDAEGMERNPLTMVNQHLDMTNKKLLQLEYPDEKDDSLYSKVEQMYLNDVRKELMHIKKEIENYSKEKTCTSIVFNWFSKNKKQLMLFVENLPQFRK